ncbi:hypothetical protein D9M68_918190 [compost metagenome]
MDVCSKSKRVTLDSPKRPFPGQASPCRMEVLPELVGSPRFDHWKIAPWTREIASTNFPDAARWGALSTRSTFPVMGMACSFPSARPNGLN